MSRFVRIAAGLVGFGLLAGSCGIVGGGDTYEVVAYFPRAVSLYEAGSVQVLGLPAGEVTEVEVLTDQVKVTMAIDSSVPLPADVQAAIVPQSLIGERRIQLFPPFQEGDAVVADGHEIPIEETVVPVEPDEALAALKEFLDSLDPEGVGRLIDNAATALDGQGQSLGSALDELSELVGNVEDADDDIIRIAERFDDFTATLLTREAQLAQVLDDFAVVADVLASERQDIELLVTSLSGLSENGLDLVSEHAVRLRTDVAIVQRLAASIGQNLDSLDDALEAGSGLVDGFINAYNPDLRALNLRTSLAPVLEESLGPLFAELGIPFPCIPVDVACPNGVLGLDDTEPVAADLGERSSPIDGILALLDAPTVADGPAGGTTDGRAEAPAPDRGWRSLLGSFLGVRS